MINCKTYSYALKILPVPIAGVHHSFTLQTMILYQLSTSMLVAYLNESSLHDESEYVIIRLIQESLDIIITLWPGQELSPLTTKYTKCRLS